MTRAARNAAPSIRRRLLLWLGVPTTLVLAGSTLSDYFVSSAPIRDAYDHALTDAALLIADNVQADSNGKLSLILPPEAISVLRADSADSIYFRVTRADGSYLAGDADLPPPATLTENPSFQSAVFRGQPIRLAHYRRALNDGVVITTVGETLNKRRRARASLLAASLSVDAIALAAILCLVWFGVNLALKPLLELHDQVARRSPRELEPLESSAVPAEVKTIVEALNRLFTAISDQSRSQRKFLESAAHQLRTPLAGVQAQLELLMAEEGAAATRDRLVLALGATRRLSHTTQQLLALARSEHAATTYSEFRPIDLAGIAEGCVSDHVSNAVAAGSDLGADLQAAPIDGIAWLIGEAIGNLIDNAIIYTPAGGTITVRTGTVGDVAFVEVHDSGVGIPESERERVTSRFVRGRESRGTGSGLGLAIVSDVAQLHGAVLTIDGGAEGRGTVVRLEFAKCST
jgi:two-component system, OmpR family, sensor histidine kinase TctE